MKKKTKLLKVKITYKQVGTPEESKQKLDRAYDILFDEVLKRRIEKKRPTTHFEVPPSRRKVLGAKPKRRAAAFHLR